MNSIASKQEDPITLIRALYVVAYDGEKHVMVPEAEVAFQGDTVVFIGEKFSGAVDKTITGDHHLLVPGFVNIHGHFTSPLARSFREDQGNRNLWGANLYDHIELAVDTRFDDPGVKEDYKTSTRLSMVELLKGGSTSFLTVGTPMPHELAEIAAETGLRAFISPGYRSGVWRLKDGRRVTFLWDEDPQAAFRGLEDNLAFIEEVRGKYGGLVQSLLGPRQLDTCSVELLKRTRQVADQTGARITIHAAQTMVEFREIIDRHGYTPIQLLAEVGLLGPDLIIAHSIFISGHSWTDYPVTIDLDLLTDSKSNVAHCPVAFARKGVALESFSRYTDRGINVGLGTDTSPQNMLEEMRVAAMVCKLVERDFAVATAYDLFHAATLGGAEALGRPDLGRIAVGSKADLLLFDLSTANLSPTFDPIRALVWHAGQSDIDKVIVNGRVVVDQGRMPHIDEETLYERIQMAAERIWRTIPDRHWEGLTAEEVSPPSLPVIAADQFPSLST